MRTGKFVWRIDGLGPTIYGLSFSLSFFLSFFLSEFINMKSPSWFLVIFGLTCSYCSSATVWLKFQFFRPPERAESPARVGEWPMRNRAHRPGRRSVSTSSALTPLIYPLPFLSYLLGSKSVSAHAVHPGQDARDRPMSNFVEWQK